MNDFQNIIKKIGEELDINVTLLSDNWMIVLEKDNETHFIQGYKFDLNNHGIGNVLDDKGMFKELLSYKGLPSVEGMSFYQVYDKNIVLDYLNKYHKLIVKGNIGTCGKNVYLVDNEEDLFMKCDYLLSKQDSISIEPYYDIKNEYRVIVLNNEVKMIYGKERPTIIGDGIHTIKELAIKFNDYFIKKNINNSDYVPKVGEVIELDFRFNLSNGAKLFSDISDELKDKIIDIALKVSKAVNITFASVDIIYTKDNKLLVLEANSGVMMDNFMKQYPNGKKIAYDIYKEAIKIMFSIS